MTKNQCMQNINELLINITDYLRKRTEALFSSGGVDPEDYKNTFELPKLLMYAALKDCTYDFSPMSDKHRALVKNLENF